jgi:hypothetical protein
MIVPTIGRVVWLYHGGLGDVLQKVQPRAALIAYVHNDRCVNLAAFDREGNSYGLTSVTLIQEGDDAPSTGGLAFCCWMPYQIGQQKKHEAAPAAA